MIKSLHFCCSNGMSRTRWMNSSCLSVIWGRVLAEIKEKIVLEASPQNKGKMVDRINLNP